MDNLRLPPQNLEAEQTVLGAMMISADVIAEVTQILGDDGSMFYRPAHGLIYESIARIFGKNEPADPITVAEDLFATGELENVGGKPYLHTLMASVPTAANARYYAQIVERSATLRSIIRAAGEIAEVAYDPPVETKEVLDTVEEIIFGLSKIKSTQEVHHIDQVIDHAFSEITELRGGATTFTGISTGFRDLDHILCGLHRSDLIIMAARPSMGKTSLALNIAQNIGLHEKTVLMFSLEMSRNQLAHRMLCSEARVSSSELRSGKLKDDEYTKLTDAASRFYGSKIYIDDSPDLTSLQIRAKARRLKAKTRDLDLVVVDYLQLMKGNSRAENRQQEISEISRSLKALARELEVPVIAISQLSRKVEERQDKRPMLSDLRESGAIEQDADVVMFIYREDYYEEQPEHMGEAKIIVAKHRNGPTGEIDMVFMRDYTKFGDIDTFHHE